MARRSKGSYKRDIGVDPRFHSEFVQKLINVVMKRGKKTVARKVVYGAFDLLTKKAQGDEKRGFELFNKAFEQIIPAVQVRSRRVGGSVYQIPTEVRPDRARALAMKWLIAAAKTRPGKTMSDRLGSELLDAYEGRGGAVKKKMDVHRMAEANRAFSHYAW